MPASCSPHSRGTTLQPHPGIARARLLSSSDAPTVEPYKGLLAAGRATPRSGGDPRRSPEESGLLTWQRSEARANLFTEKLRLLPGGKVSALGEHVEVDQFGIGTLSQNARSRSFCQPPIGVNASGGSRVPPDARRRAESSQKGRHSHASVPSFS